METLIGSISGVLGEYTVDKGIELGKAVGPKALETAAKMVTTALGHLRRDPSGKVIADEFEKAPDAGRGLLELKLNESIMSNAQLKAELEELWSQFEEAREEFVAANPLTQYAAAGERGAAAAGDHATALAERAVNVGGNVEGSPIITGDNNTVFDRPKREEDQSTASEQ